MLWDLCKDFRSMINPWYLLVHLQSLPYSTSSYPMLGFYLLRFLENQLLQAWLWCYLKNEGYVCGATEKEEGCNWNWGASEEEEETEVRYHRLTEVLWSNWLLICRAAQQAMATSQLGAPHAGGGGGSAQESLPHHILFLTNLPEETNEMMLSMLFNQSVLAWSTLICFWNCLSYPWIFCLGSLASKRCDLCPVATTSPSWSSRTRSKQEPLKTRCRASRSLPLLQWRFHLQRNDLDLPPQPSSCVKHLICIRTMFSVLFRS